MIDITKEKNINKNINFICNDYYSFSYPKLFDSMICFDAYPHFIDLDKFKLKSYELLKKDGYLIILFDISLSDINSCHHDLNFTLASSILPSKEGELFIDLFNIIKIKETSNSYLLLLQKK